MIIYEITTKLKLICLCVKKFSDIHTRTPTCTRVRAHTHTKIERERERFKEVFVRISKFSVTRL